MTLTGTNFVRHIQNSSVQAAWTLPAVALNTGLHSVPPNLLQVNSSSCSGVPVNRYEQVEVPQPTKLYPPLRPWAPFPRSLLAPPSFPFPLLPFCALFILFSPCSVSLLSPQVCTSLTWPLDPSLDNLALPGGGGIEGDRALNDVDVVNPPPVDCSEVLTQPLTDQFYVMEPPALTSVSPPLVCLTDGPRRVDVTGQRFLVIDGEPTRFVLHYPELNGVVEDAVLDVRTEDLSDCEEWSGTTHTLLSCRQASLTLPELPLAALEALANANTNTTGNNETTDTGTRPYPLLLSPTLTLLPPHLEECARAFSLFNVVAPPFGTSASYTGLCADESAGADMVRAALLTLFTSSLVQHLTCWTTAVSPILASLFLSFGLFT